MYDPAIGLAEGLALQYNFLEHAAALVATFALLEAAILGYYYLRARVSPVGSHDRLAIAVYDWNLRASKHSFVIWQVAVFGTYLAIFGHGVA
jgi:hypothetical protein